MASVAGRLSLAEFEAQYGDSDRAYEYWFGEAIPKSVHTWMHGFLQALISRLLVETGYIPATEVDLHITDDARPRPDVIASRGPIDENYPTPRRRSRHRDSVERRQDAVHPGEMPGLSKLGLPIHICNQSDASIRTRMG
jgi:hypothetical protein